MILYKYTIKFTYDAFEKVIIFNFISWNNFENLVKNNIC